MANVIKHKRGSGSDPAANNLVLGELAIRTDTGKLFTKMDSGAIAEIAGGGSDIAINTLSSSSATGGGSATFNGSAYRFTLSAPPNVSAAQLLVSINGVIQKPVAGTGQPSEGFSVDGTDIILGDAPATGSDFFILTFKSLGVSEPADNSVTSAKIADGAIVNADINASAAIAGTKISPDFGSQSITTTGSATLSGGLSSNGKDIYTETGAFISNDSNGAFATRNGSNIDHIWHDDAPGTGGTGGTWNFVSDGTYKSNGNSTIRASRYLGSGESLSFGTTQISFAGGIDVGGGGTAASGGITGSNYNITGVNAITFNDPGEGIIFKSGIELLLIDDANDNIVNLDGAAEFRVNGAITGTGNVGIGVTSPSSLGSGFKELIIGGDTEGAGIELKDGNSNVRGGLFTSDNTLAMIVRTITNHPMLFRTNNTERMRIDSSGRLLIGQTTVSSTEASGKLCVSAAISGGGQGVITGNDTSSNDFGCGLVVNKNSSTTTSSARFIQFYANNFGQPMGGIVGNGTENAQFATMSDERYKKNIKPLSGILQKINKLKTISFDWKHKDESVNAGFIAQNVQEIFPEYVVDNIGNDEQNKIMGTTGGMSAGYIAILTAAIQELSAKVAALEAA